MTATAADVTPNVAATLIDALIASNRGDRHAFEFARKTYSYQDVAALMNRTGNMIRSLGVATHARVLLLLPESPAFVASLLGVMKAGAVPVIGAPLDDDGALAHCVAAIAPAAAIVHQAYLEQASTALAGIPHGAVVVVGTNVDGYTSFVDAVRTQPSWLSAVSVHGDDPALGIWKSAGLVTIGHAGMSEFIEGNANASGASSAGEARVAAMLRAFSSGEEAQLQ
jgi:acyl-CoA synthetase (AMP-forming)/AMP-acid ligase II